MLLLTCLLVGYSFATVYYTDINKAMDKDRKGTWNRPFANISGCVAALKDPGDECHIREGRYREEVTVTGLKGSKEKPFVIRGYGEERPVLDGTVEIRPVNGSWQKEGHIYFGMINHTIWQLFFNDLMMTNARWPNGNWTDKTLFDGKHAWSPISDKSKKGLIINRDNHLQDSGLDMSGALSVLNIGSWNTFVAPVEHHQPGNNFFTYADEFGKYHALFRSGRYFMEDALQLLDAPEEWFFNKSSSVLYFIPPRNAVFTNSTILRGKVQTYNLVIEKSENVIVKNLDFFGTTLLGQSNAKLHQNIKDLKFDSLKFVHPCASRRMLHEVDVSKCTFVDGVGGDGHPRPDWPHFEFFNNTFYGSDGVALNYNGANVRLHHNLFTYNDWTGANSRTGTGGIGTIISRSRDDTLFRNTLYNNGDSHGLRPTPYCNTTLNRIIGQCFGRQSNDGAGMQVTIRPQNGAQVHQNWAHDSPKYGIRFDGAPPRIGHHGTMMNNVAFRNGAGNLQVKGDHHTVKYNLAFDAPDGRFNESVGAVPRGKVRGFPSCSLCLWKYVRGGDFEINAHTQVLHNLADRANGGAMFRNGKKVKPIRVLPLSGSVVEDNEVTVEIKSWLRDPDNEDFRLLPEYKNVTAGPYLDVSTHYWIPGRQLYKASSPVPPHNADRVIAAHRDALMWLNGYKCSTHEVYLWKHGEPQLKVGVANDGGNVVYIPEGSLPEQGNTYYWRVDAHCEEGVFEGDVWAFSTI